MCTIYDYYIRFTRYPYVVTRDLQYSGIYKLLLAKPMECYCYVLLAL